MSIIYCDKCDSLVDTDYQTEEEHAEEKHHDINRGACKDTTNKIDKNNDNSTGNSFRFPTFR